MNAKVEKCAPQNELIRALLIVLRNDTSSDYRKVSLEKAKTKVNRYAEWCLLEDELKDLDSLEKYQEEELKAKMKFKRVGLQSYLSTMKQYDEDKLFDYMFYGN